MNFKEIHLGSLIQLRVNEKKIEIFRICNFLKCSEEEVKMMYASKSIDSEMLLKWSKLLEYDFFRIYSQHMILFAPCMADHQKSLPEIKSLLPKFKKSLYTKEIISFMLNQYTSGEMSKQEIYEKYNIPKSTFHKWLDKYNNEF
ncbi:transposase [Chryseobacterium sp. M5A1_1a]